MKLLTRIGLLAALLLAGCPEEIELTPDANVAQDASVKPDAAVKPDAGCAKPCGTTCCGANQTCDTTNNTCTDTCVPQCFGKECGDNGCGTPCATCGDGTFCDSSFHCKAGCQDNAGCATVTGKPLCDTTTNTCVGCLLDGDCTGDTKRCDPDAKACVACLATSDCAAGNYCDARACKPGCNESDDCAGVAGKPVCDTAAHACVACLADGDCGGTTPKCNAAAKVCVECLAKADCGQGAYCDSTDHRCKAGCAGDADCANVAGKPLCDTAAGTCVTCLSDANCTGADKKCDPANKVCVACLATADCAAGHYCDTAVHLCQPGCGESADCAGVSGKPVCDVAAHACVACLNDTQCTGTAKKCDSATNSCVGCLATSDCGAGNWCDTAAKACQPGCDANAGCATVTGKPVCEIPTHTCVGCLADLDCTGADKKCDTAAKACVACLSTADCAADSWCDTAAKTCHAGCDDNAGCTAALPVCEVPVHTCVGCLADTDCTTPGLTRCDNPSKSCVQCLATADCGALEYCDTVVSTCKSGCDSDSGCATVAGKPVCDVAAHGCVNCVTDAHCTAAGAPKCNTAQTCVECLADADCTAGAKHLCNPSQACVECLAASDCKSGVCGAGSACGNADTCSPALELAFTAGAASVSGTLVGAANDSVGSCGGDSSPDFVYAFTLTAPATVTAALSTTTSTFRPVVYLRKACASPLAADEASCKAATAVGGTATTSAVLPAGTYYAVVDGFAGTAGAFKLDLTAVTLTAGETCMAALPLTGFDASGNGTATANGDTTSNTTETDGSCESATGPDLVYSFDVPAGMTKDVTAVMAFTSTTNRPVLYVRKACTAVVTDSANEVGCGSAASGVNTITVSPKKLPAGRYYVYADSYSTSHKGAFTLTVTLADTVIVPPPANDACAGAIDLGIADGVTLTQAAQDTTNALNDTAGGCATATYPHDGGDLVYTFTLNSAQKVVAKVTPDSGQTTYYPSVYVRTACPGTTAEDLGCATATTGGGAATATLQTLPAGTYYVIVDGRSKTAGKFSLTVTGSAVGRTGDDCASPLALTGFDAEGNGAVTVNDTTATATGSGDGTCNSASGYDLVYALDVPAGKTKDVSAKMTFTGSYRPNVYIRKSCASAAAADQLACAVAGTGVYNVTAAATRLPAGRYFIWVDGYSTSHSGPFSLVVTVTDSAALPPVPANDQCTAAVDLGTVDGVAVPTVSATTVGAASDSVGSCGTGTGGDVVFQFTTTKTQLVVAKVAADTGSTLVPNVYLRGACPGLAAEERACASGSGTPSTATAIAAALPAGTYFLVVDGNAATSGAFKLDLSAQDTLPETCAMAKALTGFGPDGNGTVTVNADTALAVGDTNGSCNTSSGPDSGLRRGPAGRRLQGPRGQGHPGQRHLAPQRLHPQGLQQRSDGQRQRGGLRPGRHGPHHRHGHRAQAARRPLLRLRRRLLQHGPGAGGAGGDRHRQPGGSGQRRLRRRLRDLRPGRGRRHHRHRRGRDLVRHRRPHRRLRGDDRGGPRLLLHPGRAAEGDRQGDPGGADHPGPRRLHPRQLPGHRQRRARLRLHHHRRDRGHRHRRVPAGRHLLRAGRRHRRHHRRLQAGGHRRRGGDDHQRGLQQPQRHRRV
ncbi:MAG: hypothetical protein QM765_46935 [Myxococcales bacterium]